MVGKQASGKSRTTSGSQPFKLAFIDVKYRKKIILPKLFVKAVPKRVALFASIQFHGQLDNLAAQLEKAGKQVTLLRPKHSWHEGQLLGCGVEDWSKYELDCFVYIGDGDFHPTALLFKNDLPVHQYDPKSGETRVLTQKYIEPLIKRRKGGLATFYSSKRIGVLITTKYGQERMERAFKLEQEYPEKEFYFLLDDQIDPARLEDFPFLDCYVNTACPRMRDDRLPRPTVNLTDITAGDW